MPDESASAPSDADTLGDLGLEALHHGPGGCYPARAQGLHDEPLLEGADIGPGQVDPFVHDAACASR